MVFSLWLQSVCDLEEEEQLNVLYSLPFVPIRALSVVPQQLTGDGGAGCEATHSIGGEWECAGEKNNIRFDSVATASVIH